MSNDELVAKLNERLEADLEYSEKIERKGKKSPDREKLKELAHSIRKNLEELQLEASVHTKPGI